MQREEEAEEEQMMRMCDGGKVESTLNEEESRRITMGAGISSCQSANTVHIAADKLVNIGSIINLVVKGVGNKNRKKKFPQFFPPFLFAPKVKGKSIIVGAE